MGHSTQWNKKKCNYNIYKQNDEQIIVSNRCHITAPVYTYYLQRLVILTFTYLFMILIRNLIKHCIILKIWQ